jgi:WS/DGAT/MGAT family acyltransferase
MGKGALFPGLSAPLTGKIGQERCYDFTAMPFDDIKTIRAAFGGTVNDVALTMVVAGFRALLDHRDISVDGKRLQIMVPVALRARDQHGKPIADGTMETKASAMIARIPLDIDDPVERLAFIHDHLAELKGTSQVEAMSAINDIQAIMPAMMSAAWMRRQARRPQRAIHTTVTNVHGPTEQLYVMGGKIKFIANYAPPFPIGARTSVAVYSYQGQLTFGINADKAAIPDVDLIVQGIDEARNGLLTAAAQNPDNSPAKPPRTPRKKSAG